MFDQQPLHAFRLIEAVFDDDPAFAGQVRPSPRDDRPDRLQTITAALERATGLETEIYVAANLVAAAK